MGPIRRSSKRKAEPESSGQPAAAEAEPRGGKPVKFILRSSERLRPPTTPRSSAPQTRQTTGRRRQRMPRRVYRFLADLSSSDALTCYKRGKNIVDVSVKETRKSVVTSEALTNAENDKGKEVCNDATSPGIISEVNTTTCIDSAPLKYWKGLQGSTVPEIIDVPVGIIDLDQENYIEAQQHATEFSFMSDNPADADVFLSSFPTPYGNNGTETDKCATSMEQDISEESFEQYLVRSDGDNDDLLPLVKSCQTINHDHHPSEENVAALMECKTSSVVATESVSVMPLAMIHDVVPNLLPSNATSDTCKEDHLGDTGLLGNMAAIEQPSTESLFSAISLPALKGDIINTQSPNKNFAAEDQQGVSLEDRDPPTTEYTADSSQSIGHSAVNQLFSSYLRNSAEAELGNRLTSPEDTDGTPSKCVESGPDELYCPLLQRSPIHESTITDRPSESLAIESQPFVKTLPLWEHIEEMEIFKKVPQRPHFHPFKKLGPELCESMSLGLMVFFGKTADNIRSLNIQDDNDLFMEKMKGLCLLEEHGFDVTLLRSRLETLLHIKNSRCELLDTLKKLEEKITLKETDGQQRDAQIGMLYSAIRQIERQVNIFRCILKSSVSQQKTEASEVSRLKTEASDLEQSYLSAEQHFSSVVSAPW
ncbi:hypothetical protein EJB05_17868 [Eragrostis curvula]|uniref:Uncharacterized protein n=1 Tax=Eragrostis curvula TaxID=38414 RepID=A0A5J9VK44_9POAL|nr:hypothetical protein EJB05_17868 [Eragrostis curvula]